MITKSVSVLILSAATVAALTGCVRPAVSPYPVPSASASASSRANCDGRDLTLNQPAVHFDLSGSCGTISIQGQDITVTLQKAKALTINGDRNTVKVGTLGAVTIEGQDNGISATVIGALAISGDRNSVTATTLGSKTVSGQNNTVLG